MTALDHCVSELENQEQIDSYNRWFCAQVQEAIDSQKPRIPHNQVMAEMWAVIDEYVPQQAAV